MYPFKSAGRQETRTMTALSFVFGTISLLFIARHIPGVPEWISGLPRDFFLAALPSSAIALLAGVSYFTPLRRFESWISKTLFLILPAMIAFSIGWHFQNAIPDTAKIAVTFYVFAIGLFFFVGLTRRKNSGIHDPFIQEPGMRQWLKAQGWIRLAAIVTLSGLFFGFAVQNLGKSANVDEALWLYGRIPKYWNALGNLEFQKTSISDKPGITVAIISGAGLLSVEDPLPWKSLRGNDRGLDEFFFTFRIPIVIVITLLLPLFYYLLERVAGRTRALFAFGFITLSPATVGMAKIINPDALLWVFTPLSLFAYLAYLKRRHAGFLLLSGVLLGLALLTKYVANILFVFALGIIFLEYLFRRNEERFLPYLKRSLLAYAVWTFSAIAVFFLLFPATWLKPEKLLDATILSQAFESTAAIFLSVFAAILLDRLLNRSRFSETVMLFFRSIRLSVARIIGIAWIAFLGFILFNTWSGMAQYDFPTLLAAPKTILSETSLFGVFSANAYPLLFGITPIALLFLLLAPLFFFREKSLESATGKTILYGIVFIVLYFLGSAINGVGAITRYEIILFPIAAAIAGFGIGTMVKSLEAVLPVRSETLGIAMKKYSASALFLVVMVASVFSLATTPFPLSYASILLPMRYHTDVKDMGPGSYEAAEYLNALPDAKHLTVWSDKDGVCKFFVGRCKSGFSWDAYENIRFDYIVVSSGRESRTSKRVGTAVEDLRKNTIRFDTYYDRTEGAAWELLINGRPSHYVKIYPFIP